MDTIWFAVDPGGHVAAFDTGQDGHAPIRAERQHFLEALYDDRHPDAWRDTDVRPNEELAADVGFFLYRYRDSYDPIDVFERKANPDWPINVDQLPPEVRAACKKVRFPVSFVTADRLQPLDHEDCSFWEEDGERFAYLAADGVTVRPVRGKEARYPQFVRRFQEEFPDDAAHYRFEGVDDGR
jgi:hypothetical protein